MGDDLLERRISERGLAATAVQVSLTIRPDTIGPGHVDLPVLAIDASGDFEIRSTLGEGGMGKVHLAQQRSLAREVALKSLKPDAGHVAHEALVREAQLMGALEHPGVIPVHALGTDAEGRPVLVMKRVDGVDLATLLRNPEHAAWRSRDGDRLVASLEILVQVCLTLEFAHAKGVIHRDIKPENVMVGAFGEVYVLDWGIAVSADDPEPQSLAGTPLYMAPEMALGKTVDARTDVYLLGATLHAILTGRGRHTGQNVVEVLRSALTSAPIAYPPNVPSALASLCNRATSREPSSRPPSVRALREEITGFLRHRSARALTDAARERLGELERTLAEADGPPRDLVRAYRLATEARFGLTESLRQNDDPDVRLEMRRCLSLAIDLELRQDHADTADALLGEMNPPETDLAHRIESVRKQIVMRERERTRLEMLERDFDPRQHAQVRTGPIAGLGLVIITTLTVVGIHGKTPSALTLVAVNGLGSLAIVLGIVILRRYLNTTFNRRFAALVMLTVGSALVHRIIGLVTHTPPEQTLSGDLMLFALASTATSITLVRKMWMCVPPLLVGVVVVRLRPDITALAFAIACICAVAVGGIALARAGRSAREAPPQT